MELKSYGKMFIIVVIYGLIAFLGCRDCDDQIEYECEVRKQSFTFVEQMPQFPGGQDSLTAFIKSRLIYPEKSKLDKVEGIVKINFVVNKYGNIECVEILESLNTECDNESLRLINIMPLWIAGKHNGNEVAISITISIDFKL